MSTLSLTFNVSGAPYAVTLPIVEDPADPITFTIDWGDSTTDSLLTHTYATDGPFTAVVTITAGSVTSFGAPIWVGSAILTAVATTSVTDWGLPGVTSFSDAFNNAALLTSVPTYIPSSVTNTNAMFQGASLFNADISGWNVSSVTNMSNMFNGASAFNQDISSWNVSSVTNMNSMFRRCSAFNADISSWNVSSVTDMAFMLQGTSVFDKNIGGWNVGNVVTMSSMLESTNAFNQDISLWDVSKVVNMSYMFYAAAAFNQDLSSWAFTLVENMSNMFANTTAFNQDISSWVLPAVNDMSRMFSGASTFNNGGVALTWTTQTSSVTNMSNMFNGASAFNQDISSWNVSSVTNMSEMFTSAAAFNNNGAALTWSAGTGTSNVTNMNSMFRFCSAFNADISSWNVSSVTDMAFMLQGTSVFNQYIGGWNVSLVTNMSSLFDGASTFDQDISSWNVSGVTDMSYMFNNATTFDQPINLWVVNGSANFTDMFLGATAMAATYGSDPGYGDTPLYTFFNQVPPTPYPCFLEGTQILCLENDQEVYRPVESLRKGDLVKTIYNGYLPVHMIGTTPMYNPNNNDRIANRLYKCPKENYPGLLEDLYITGCHSILVPWLTYEQGQKTIASLGRLFVTDKHCRLMAWVDEKAVPYKMEGVYNIYHVALENEDYYMNYGIYANGLLVESCSKRYLMERSNMRILGEEDSSLTEDVSTEENIFHKMSCLVETC